MTDRPTDPAGPPSGPPSDDPLDALAAEVVEPAGTGPLRALLLEDDDDHAALVEALLDGATPEVTLVRARTVGEAEDLLGAGAAGGGPFDVVLADQQLPDSSYWETVARVSEAAGGVPVVALTTLGDDATASSPSGRGPRTTS